jgi:hypothetical protein
LPDCQLHVADPVEDEPAEIARALVLFSVTQKRERSRGVVGEEAVQCLDEPAVGRQREALQLQVALEVLELGCDPPQLLPYFQVLEEFELACLIRALHKRLGPALDLTCACFGVGLHRMGCAVGRLLSQFQRIVHQRQRLLGLGEKRAEALLAAPLARRLPAHGQLVELRQPALVADAEDDRQETAQGQDGEQHAHRPKHQLHV